MKVLSEHKLTDSISIKEVDKFPDDVFQNQLKAWLTTKYPFLPWREKLSEEESSKLDSLKKNLMNRSQLRLALIAKDELVGWSFGWQDSLESFYMAASAVAPGFRRQGYYSELVRHVLKLTHTQGYQTVSSRHILTNNSVLIAKLKLGFIVKGIEVDPVHGTLLNLHFHHNELLNSANRFRVGAVGESEIRNLLVNQSLSS